MISNIELIENEGKRQGLHGRKLKGFVKSKLRKIIKKLRKEGKL
jgi:hypothetical protein